MRLRRPSAAALMSGCVGIDGNDACAAVRRPGEANRLRRRQRRPADGRAGQDRARLRDGSGRSRYRPHPRPPSCAGSRSTTTTARWSTSTPRGGYGVLYGPNIDRNGADTLGEGKIAGVEYIAYARRRERATQTSRWRCRSRAPGIAIGRASSPPRRRARAAFTARSARPANGASSAAARSRMPTRAPAWACTTCRPTPSTCSRARASTAAAAGQRLQLQRSLTGAALAAFNAAHPNRIAVKHAHSQQNPEQDWGRDTLHAVRFAIYALNEEKGDRNPDGTTRRAYQRRQHDRHRLVGQQRRRGRARGSRAGYGQPDRRRGRGRAGGRGRSRTTTCASRAARRR